MNDIKKYLNIVEDDMIQDLLRLLKHKSIKINENSKYPFGKDIHEVLNYLATIIEKFDFDRYARYGDYYSWIEIGDPKLPLVGVICHIDIVDFVEEEWNYDPLGEIVNETIYGRGVSDNKGPIIQILYAMKYIKEKELPMRIRLIIGADEEKDFKCMKKYIENDEEMPAYGFIPDAKFPYIISEKGLLNFTIQFEEKKLGLPIHTIEGGTATNISPNYSKVIFPDNSSISAKGVAAHIANDSTDDNAIISMVKKIKQETPENSFITKFKEVVYKNYLKFILDDEEIVVKPTLIEQKGSLIYITFDTRVPVEISTKKVAEMILEHFNFDNGAIQRINRADGYEYQEHHPIIKIISQVYKDNIQFLRPKSDVKTPLRISGTTYAKYFENCITFGPGFPGEHSYAHREDERLTIQSFMDGTYIYIKLLEKFWEEKVNIL